MDLDGALSGKNQNQNAIKDILDSSKCNMQLGGGIRSFKKNRRVDKIRSKESYNRNSSHRE